MSKKIRNLVIVIFNALSPCFIQRHYSAKIISVVKLLLMIFRLLNKLKVERNALLWSLMPSHLKGMWSVVSRFLSV